MEVNVAALKAMIEAFVKAIRKQMDEESIEIDEEEDEACCDMIEISSDEDDEMEIVDTIVISSDDDEDMN